MRMLRQSLALTLALAAASQATAAIYVSQVGETGSATALSNASTAMFIQRFDNGGILQETFALPTAAENGNLPYANSGTATSEGFLTRSADGQFLTLAGYSIAPGSSGVATSTSETAPRAVARFNIATEAIDVTTVFSGDTTYSGGNVRSSVTSDGTTYWLGGSNQGLRTATHGANTSSLVSTTATNLRVVNIFNGDLYVSSGTAALLGISKVGTGLPTGTGETMTQVVNVDNVGTGNESPYDFWFKDANTLFVADDRTAANGGGLQKWTFDTNSMVWSHAYTLNVGAGARGLAGTVNEGGQAVLYATTADNPSRLASITDTGMDAVFATLATAGTNTQFRGVEFVADTVTPPTNNSDFDNDGDVDGADFLTWQANLGASGQPNKSTGDATGDGNVNAADLTEWQSHFGGAPAAGAASSVPEPATGAIAALGLALVAAGRRSRRMLN